MNPIDSKYLRLQGLHENDFLIAEFKESQMARVASEVSSDDVGPRMYFDKAKLDQYRFIKLNHCQHLLFLHLLFFLAILHITCSHMVSKFLSTALTMSLMLAVSIFLYGTFYYAYMPVELVNMPVSPYF